MKRSLLDYFGPSKRSKCDESILPSHPSGDSVSDGSSSSTTHNHTDTTDDTADDTDTVASESTQFCHCTSTNIPSDIAAGPLQPPVQPVVNFPPRTFGSKKQSFNCEWYKLYPWLEYSRKMMLLTAALVIFSQLVDQEGQM